MSSTRTSSFRKAKMDHFEPQDSLDTQEQRRLRGHLEQIDFAAFEANRRIIGQAVGAADAQLFHRLAGAAAQARAAWAAAALRMVEASPVLRLEEVEKLARLRSAYEELTEVYEGVRRMVERGYLTFRDAPK